MMQIPSSIDLVAESTAGSTRAEPSHKVWVVKDEVFNLETRFTVKEYLGAGAYGVVCSAYESDPSSLVAIKKCKKVLNSRTMAKRM